MFGFEWYDDINEWEEDEEEDDDDSDWGVILLLSGFRYDIL